MGKAYIGTGGWNYKHWSQGVFYPKDLKPSEWLKYFVGYFDSEVRARTSRSAAATIDQGRRNIPPNDRTFRNDSKILLQKVGETPSGRQRKTVDVRKSDEATAGL